MRTEKQEQQAITRVVQALGGSVWDTSDYRAVHVTKGLPDLVCFLNKPIMVWWETKSAKGKPSDAQLNFKRHCDRCNQYMGIGTCDDFKNFLKQFGYGFM